MKFFIFTATLIVASCQGITTNSTNTRRQTPSLATSNTLFSIAPPEGGVANGDSGAGGLPSESCSPSSINFGSFIKDPLAQHRVRTSLIDVVPSSCVDKIVITWGKNRIAPECLDKSNVNRIEMSYAGIVNYTQIHVNKLVSGITYQFRLCQLDASGTIIAGGTRNQYYTVPVNPSNYLCSTGDLDTICSVVGSKTTTNKVISGAGSIVLEKEAKIVQTRSYDLKVSDGLSFDMGENIELKEVATVTGIIQRFRAAVIQFAIGAKVSSIGYGHTQTYKHDPSLYNGGCYTTPGLVSTWSCPWGSTDGSGSNRSAGGGAFIGRGGQGIQNPFGNSMTAVAGGKPYFHGFNSIPSAYWYANPTMGYSGGGYNATSGKGGGFIRIEALTSIIAQVTEPGSKRVIQISAEGEAAAAGFGGGSGGAIWITAPQISGILNITASGGNGGAANTIIPNSYGGGGGGGGFIKLETTQPIEPGSISCSVSAGKKGLPNVAFVEAEPGLKEGC